MAIAWSTPAGNLGTLEERAIIQIPIVAISSIGPVSYRIIAGKLPTGLRLDNGVIKGSPGEVQRSTVSRFVVRASDGDSIKDITFNLVVNGSDVPEWVTKEGYLNVGQGNNYFVLDNAYVNYKLVADDRDIIAGDKLEFYQVLSGGQLPPGLALSRDGVISGFTDPIFAVDYDNQTGAFDTVGYDISPLDVYRSTSNGFDTFLYDTFTFDYSDESITPKRISRSYSFVIAASDGLHEVRQVFKMWVVTEEFLKSDNTIVQVDTNLFRADNNSNRAPIWITESDLGRYRANNYVTIYLDVYNPPSLPGSITYFLIEKNPGKYKIIETGQTVDGNFELSNIIPYFKYSLKGPWSPFLTYNAGDAVIFQSDTDPAVINQTWVRLSKNNIENIENIEPQEGFYWTKNNLSTIDQTFQITNRTLWETIVPESISELPPGMELDRSTGEIAGRVPYQRPTAIGYKFTMQAVNFPAELSAQNYDFVGDWNPGIFYTENQTVRFQGFIYICRRTNKNIYPTNLEFWEIGVSSSEKTFTVSIVGEIENSITWVSSRHLGTIKTNQPSTLEVKAIGLAGNSKIVYELSDGVLPPGLSVSASGSIQGKVKQFADASGKGLTRFFEVVDGVREFNTTFSLDNTTFDRDFNFKIKAKDTANFAESIKDFVISINATDSTTFANLYIKAFQEKSKRLQWTSFITDVNIFNPSEIYRVGDPNFGVQTTLRVLVYAGIESIKAEKYIQAMAKNHYQKQLKFGNVSSAIGRDLVTQEVLYEVVYVEIVDEYEKNGKSISKTVNLPDNINSKVLTSYDSIKVDSDIPFVSDSDHQRIFPNSFKNMRSRIKEAGIRDREFLPAWMRSIQPNSPVESGYVKALVLCYTKVGFAESVISRIKLSGFDFKTINFTADRYIIDIIDGTIEDKYLAFPQRGEKLP
jgi:hypothetical protein